MSNIFNLAKTAEEYATKRLFSTGDLGLVDTINRFYPKLNALYKEMKSLDWDENEFDYSQCLIDFEQAPKDTSEMMLDTIMFQWESDSVASQAPVSIIQPMQPCTEVWQGELRITDNESVHANTYSEIVRMGFKIPQEVLTKMLSIVDAHKRLEVVGKALKDVQLVSIKIAYNRAVNGVEPTEEEVAEYMILFYFAMLCLERIQFLASFAVTFTICQGGYFQPIGMAVKKICQDELEVHAEWRKEILKELIATEIGAAVFERLKPRLEQMMDEVIQQELDWTNNGLFKNGERTLLGTNAQLVSGWVLYMAADVAKTFDLKSRFKFPRQNPMPHLRYWVNMNKNQSAPQEQDNPAYKVGIVVANDAGKIYSF